MKKRKTYTEDFIKDTVNLVATSKATLKKIGEDLGVDPNLISKWKQRYKNKADGTVEKIVDPKDIEITNLKKELSTAKMERDILKKSIAIFSRY